MRTYLAFAFLWALVACQSPPTPPVHDVSSEIRGSLPKMYYDPASSKVSYSDILGIDTQKKHQEQKEHVTPSEKTQRFATSLEDSSGIHPQKAPHELKTEATSWRWGDAYKVPIVRHRS